MSFASDFGVYIMHSLETGIIISIAAFFFFYLFIFVFLRENNISQEIKSKYESEALVYAIGNENDYRPDKFNNLLNIYEEVKDVGEN